MESRVPVEPSRMLNSVQSATPRRPLKTQGGTPPVRKDGDGLSGFRPSDPSWTPPSQQAMLKVTGGARLSKASPAPDYDARFQRDSGWVGADGSYSVPMSDGSTVWLFSDTFWGEVLSDGRRTPGTAFVNNTIAHQRGDQISFFHGGQEGEPRAVFSPPDGKGWFWLHDAVASLDDTGKLHVMLGQFDKTADGGVLGFEAVGGWLAELQVTEDGPRVEGYRKLPHFQRGGDGKPSIFFGTSMMREGEHFYVYGVRDHGLTKEAVVARVPARLLARPESWEFFDGKGWASKMEQAQPIANDVSVEQSVHKTVQGDFVLVAQGGGISPNVVVRRAERPEGPWSEPETVYVAPENAGQDVTYNAKAHPELSDERGLLVSYNVNTLDWERNLADGHIYRPRFVRVKDTTLLPAQATPSSSS
jgi:hypothetical protein